MIYEVANNKRAEELFAGWDESIIWSCLQGVMGHIYAENKDAPASAMAILGDFCFFAGEPNMELASFRPTWYSRDGIIAVPGNAGWSKIIESVYGNRAEKVTRYAIKKEQGVFDKGRLKEIVRGLSEDYALKLIDEEIFSYCKKTRWCGDFVAQYVDWKQYQKLGLGAVILKDGVVVSGAASYSSYMGGIEIEIDTKKEYRRRGLGLVCGARLVLECLDRGVYPSWDAANTASVRLAEKLGYHLDYEYDAYEVDFTKIIEREE